MVVVQPNDVCVQEGLSKDECYHPGGGWIVGGAAFYGVLSWAYPALV